MKLRYKKDDVVWNTVYYDVGGGGGEKADKAEKGDADSVGEKFDDGEKGEGETVEKRDKAEKGEKVDDVLYDGVLQLAIDNGIEKGEKVDEFQSPFDIAASLINKILNTLRDAEEEDEDREKNKQIEDEGIKIRHDEGEEKIAASKPQNEEIDKPDKGEDVEAIPKTDDEGNQTALLISVGIGCESNITWSL
ncbi:hypothetical protein Drorol1_Dr00020540 [Drosera rotundifolia]